MDELHAASRARYENGRPGEAGLKTLLSRLNQDATQLIHDELDLAKLEIREVTETFSIEVRDATSTLVKDLTKAGIALSLAGLAGLTLTAGLVLAIGDLLGAYWAGALIVGVVLLVATLMFAKSAASDMKENDALRLERTRRAAGQDARVLKEEVRELAEFAKHEAREFKEHASPNRTH
ncbi:MAG: phage holin family protein [Gemmatimonadota bacterium]